MTSCNNNRVGSVYNKATNSKVHRGKLGTVPKATQVDPGLMTKEDFCKLEALIVPPPSISLTSNNCGTVITGGIISFVAGDNYIKVDSFVNIKQNEDGTASPTYSLVPIKIHDNTYGIRFSLDINRLSFFLTRNNRLRIKGATGEQGIVGEQGIKGDDYILSGPRGRKGPTGSTPPIENTLQIEDIDTVQVGATGITNIQPRINTDGTYDLIVTRQPVGNPNVSTNKIALAPGSSSWWAVVVANPGTARTPYYLDMEGIVNSIHTRATSYADIIKTGYEDAVKFWIQTMSDLFDCQKSALCCAIERCESRKKSNELRQHWESTAAAAKPDYAATIRPREDASETGPSTGVLEQLYDDLDCGGSNSDCGVTPPSGGGGGNGGGGGGGGNGENGGGNGENGVESGTDVYGLIWTLDTPLTQPEVIELSQAIKLVFNALLSQPTEVVFRAAISASFRNPDNTSARSVLRFPPTVLNASSTTAMNNFIAEIGTNFSDLFDGSVERLPSGTSFLSFPGEFVGSNMNGVAVGETSNTVNINGVTSLFQNGDNVPFKFTGIPTGRQVFEAMESVRAYYVGNQSTGSVTGFLNYNSIIVIAQTIIDAFDTPLVRNQSLSPITTFKLAPGDELVSVDAKFHITYPTKATKITLDRGVYEFQIVGTDSNINNSYRGDVTILHKIGMSTKMASFLDKGSYESAEDSRSAYVGEVLTLEHNGGPVKLYYNAVNSSKVINSGSTQIQIHRIS